MIVIMLSSGYIEFSNTSSSKGFNMFYPGDLSVLSDLGKLSHSPIKRWYSHPICCSPTHLLLSFGTMITPLLEPSSFKGSPLATTSQYVDLALSTLLPLLPKPVGGKQVCKLLYFCPSPFFHLNLTPFSKIFLRATGLSIVSSR